LLISSHNAVTSGKLVTNRFVASIWKCLTLLQIVIDLIARNLYYEERGLFGSVERVKDLVDGLACILGVERHELGIVGTVPGMENHDVIIIISMQVAALKGLLAGPVCLRTWSSQTAIDGEERNDGILIPMRSALRSIDLGPVQWTLVVEKEASVSFISCLKCGSPGLGPYGSNISRQASFRSLAAMKLWRSCEAGPCLIVTVSSKDPNWCLPTARLMGSRVKGMAI
jgi:hypothetical protein